MLIKGVNGMLTNKNHPDADLIEDIDEEELEKIVLEAQQEALQNAKNKVEKNVRVERWKAWLVAIVFVFSGFSFFLQTYSIPAIDFLITSSQLSKEEHIQLYKKSVVSIATNNSSGTGFSISDDGLILTNYHVIEDKQQIMVNFPDDGIHQAEVIATYPEIDTALLQIDGDDFPYLPLDDSEENYFKQHVQFIGNPLRFQWIVNEGRVINETFVNDIVIPVTMLQAPVYRGNSGSPVFNDEGLVIGVIFATTRNEEHGKVGLFIPIQPIIEKLQEDSLIGP